MIELKNSIPELPGDAMLDGDNRSNGATLDRMSSSHVSTNAGGVQEGETIKFPSLQQMTETNQFLKTRPAYPGSSFTSSYVLIQKVPSGALGWVNLSFLTRRNYTNSGQLQPLDDFRTFMRQSFSDDRDRLEWLSDKELTGVSTINGYAPHYDLQTHARTEGQFDPVRLVTIRCNAELHREESTTPEAEANAQQNAQQDAQQNAQQDAQQDAAKPGKRQQHS